MDVNSQERVKYLKQAEEIKESDEGNSTEKREQFD